MDNSRIFSRKTKMNILKILRVLREAAERAEGFLTISEVGRRSGIHKWSVSRIIDLYMPYVEVKIIDELEDVGMKLKLVALNEPSITEEAALRYLNIRL